MEVTSDSAHDDGEELQAGKADTLRMLWLLSLLFIGCRKEN